MTQAHKQATLRLQQKQLSARRCTAFITHGRASISTHPMFQSVTATSNSGGETRASSGLHRSNQTSLSIVFTIHMSKVATTTTQPTSQNMTALQKVAGSKKALRGMEQTRKMMAQFRFIANTTPLLPLELTTTQRAKTRRQTLSKLDGKLKELAGTASLLFTSQSRK